MVMYTLTLLCTLVAKSELPEVRAHHVHEVKQTSVIQQQQGVYQVMDCNSCYDNILKRVCSTSPSGCDVIFVVIVGREYN